MIIGKIKDIDKYIICPEMNFVANFILDTELNRLSYANYELNDNVLLNVDIHNTNLDSRFISKENKIEIHIITDGLANYEYADFDDQSITLVESNDDDLESYYIGEKRGSFLLDNTMFMIVLPDDVIKYDLSETHENIVKAIFTINIK